MLWRCCELDLHEAVDKLQHDAERDGLVERIGQDAVQAILAKFDTVSVIHGHTHQLLLNRIGNISFYGLLSTAWPWPYAPEGLPKLTVQMNRADPFNAFDGCGDGQLNVLASGMIDKVYNLWNRNPVTVRANYLSSNGANDRPPATTLASY